MFLKKPIIPQFFGYNNHPSWPLKEDYSKWMLTLYKPWRLHNDETKDNYQDFKSSLIDYMWNENFPRSILHSILRCKLNLLDEIDMEEAADMVCPETNTDDGGEAVEP